jgi:predicted histidine transporter YuiF (NhaC family)
MNTEVIIAFLDDLFTQDTNGKLLVAILGAMATALVQGYLKRQRLRAAIRVEVQQTSEQYKALFAPERRSELEATLRVDPNYIVVILTTERHVVIGNLTDDIGFMNIYTASRILRFNDMAELIDDAIHFMRTHEFRKLPLDRKLRVLAVPFERQNEFQGLAMQLLEEL